MTVFRDILMLKATNKKRGIITPRFKTSFYWSLLPENQCKIGQGGPNNQ